MQNGVLNLAAYGVGGPTLLVRTVEQLTHVRVDHFAVIDFAGFRQMVDAVTRWAFESRGLMRVQLEHAVPNLASCRVADASGFLLEGTARSAYAVPGGRAREDGHIHGRIPTDRRLGV